MAVLIACEESQAVTVEFRKLGVETYSCDLKPCSGKHPEWHLQQDVLPLLKEKWNLIIAFPPCTHLAVSGRAWLKQKRKDGRLKQGLDFFLEFAKVDCKHVAIENPISVVSTYWRQPDQIIQPWMFGHPETKATCLWLKNLSALHPTNSVKYIVDKLTLKERKRVHYLPNNSDRAKIRSKTYSGIAKAMASQWVYVLKE